MGICSLALIARRTRRPRGELGSPPAPVQYGWGVFISACGMEGLSVAPERWIYSPVAPQLSQAEGYRTGNSVTG